MEMTNVQIISNNTGNVVLEQQIEVTEDTNIIAEAYNALTKRFSMNNLTARMNYFVVRK